MTPGATNDRGNSNSWSPDALDHLDSKPLSSSIPPFMIAAPRIQPMSGRTVLLALNEGDNDHEVLR